MLVYLLVFPFILGAQVDRIIAERRAARRRAFLAERMAYLEAGWIFDE